MHSSRTPLFLPAWSANLFERVAEHHDEARWYSRMMDALLECDDWDAYYHRQTAALLEDLVLPVAGTVTPLVGRTVELHHEQSMDHLAWTRHYRALFHSAFLDDCARYSSVERFARGCKP